MIPDLEKVTDDPNIQVQTVANSNQVIFKTQTLDLEKREAFAKYMADEFGVEEKDENGEKMDMTTEEAAITNSTSVMLSTVAQDVNAIGYVSLGSLDDSVTAVKIDGAEATAESIESGDYKVVRPCLLYTSPSPRD